MLGKDGNPWTWVMDEPDPNENNTVLQPPKPARISLTPMGG